MVAVVALGNRMRVGAGSWGWEGGQETANRRRETKDGERREETRGIVFTNPQDGQKNGCLTHLRDYYVQARDRDHSGAGGNPRADDYLADLHVRGRYERYIGVVFCRRTNLGEAVLDAPCECAGHGLCEGRETVRLSGAFLTSVASGRIAVRARDVVAVFT